MTHLVSKRSPEKKFRLVSIHGNCLEKLGVHNEGGGYAIIDCNATPKIGDIVHCCKPNANISSYLKQLKRIEGDTYIVGTAYYDESKNIEWEAGEILGVVLETYGRLWGYREYVRPTHLRKKSKGANNERTT